MRKKILTCGLVGAVMFVSAADLVAQPILIGVGPWYCPGHGYVDYYRSNYGYRNSTYGWAHFYFPPPASFTVMPTPLGQARGSYFFDPNSAQVTVLVPSHDTKIWFDGVETTQRGTERTYYTPALQLGTHTYVIRARWTENGRPVEHDRRVRVEAGLPAVVDFRVAGEAIPQPPGR